MYSLQLSLFLTSLVFTCTTLLPYGRFADAAMKLDIRHEPFQPNLVTRRAPAGTLDISIQNSLNWTLGGFYRTEITLGNPPQTLQVVMDTGSSNLAVNSVAACKNLPSGTECLGGTFDSTTSISYKELPGLPFNNTYIDGTGSAGHYGTDVLFFGGVTLQNATFGLAETPGLHTTMFGIGPDPDLYSRKPLNTTIVSTLDALVAAGVTKSKLLSLYLNELNSPSGSIVFGGVDESKFDTNAGFVTLDILRDPLAKNQVRDFYLVQMTKLSVMLNDKTETIPISSSPSMPWLPVSVDSGSSFTMVPSQFFQTINTYVNATYFPELQGYGLPCVAAQNETLKNTIVSWTPGDPLSPSVSITYNISVADLVVPLYNIGTTTPVTATFDGKEMAACAFGIQPSYEGLDGLGVIGMPFLRRMYVVFDQDNEEISFGYPTFNADDSNIVEVQKISGSPYAKQVESQSDADASTQTLFSFYNVTSSSNVTSTATGSGLTGPTVSSGAPRTGAVAVIVAIVAAAAGFALGM